MIFKSIIIVKKEGAFCYCSHLRISPVSIWKSRHPHQHWEQHWHQHSITNIVFYTVQSILSKIQIYRFNACFVLKKNVKDISQKVFRAIVQSLSGKSWWWSPFFIYVCRNRLYNCNFIDNKLPQKTFPCKCIRIFSTPSERSKGNSVFGKIVGSALNLSKLVHHRLFSQNILLNKDSYKNLWESLFIFL